MDIDAAAWENRVTQAESADLADQLVVDLMALVTEANGFHKRRDVKRLQFFINMCDRITSKIGRWDGRVMTVTVARAWAKAMMREIVENRKVDPG
jgi:hypothetical protein